MDKGYMVAPHILDYVESNSLRLSQHQMKLLSHTQRQSNSMMIGSPDMIQHFQVLLRAMGAKRCLEIGTFTGYTSLSLAQTVPNDGYVFTCDVSDKSVAFSIWKEANVDHKIKFLKGPAVNSLDKLISDGYAGWFDFAFIDADKQNNKEYYEKCMILVRSGGIIAIDNVIWMGMVADPRVQDPTTNMIREFNLYVRNDLRVESSMLTVGDGVLICYKK